jgi:hypothetical protein
LHLIRFCARLDHLGQDLLLLMRLALHRLYEVRDQVGATLILVQHFAPRGLYLFVNRRNFVDAASRKTQEYEREGCQTCERPKVP